MEAASEPLGFSAAPVFDPTPAVQPSPPPANEAPSVDVDDSPVIDLLDSDREEDSLSGSPDDTPPLASASDFVQYERQPSPTAKTAIDVSLEEPMPEVQSGSLAAIANTSATELSEESLPLGEEQVPLASAADFIDSPQVRSAGASFVPAPVVPEAPAPSPPSFDVDITTDWNPPDPEPSVIVSPELKPNVVVTPEPIAVGTPVAMSPAEEPEEEIDLVDEAEPEAPPPPAPAPVNMAPLAPPLGGGKPTSAFGQPGALASAYVAGEHRVIVHTIEGQVKRGVIRDVDLLDATIALELQAGHAPENIPIQRMKAVFFMLPPGKQPSPTNGEKVRVTFNDGRQVAGFSNDVHDDLPGFFMVPADNRTNTARIFVYRASVRSVGPG
ncbi:MAG: DUF6982 domain-containing protein [Myxococcota bacterium]